MKKFFKQLFCSHCYEVFNTERRVKKIAGSLMILKLEEMQCEKCGKFKDKFSRVEF